MRTQDFLLWEMRSRDSIDVKRCYIDAAGDLVCGVLLSQIIYWHLPDEHGNTRLRVHRDEHDWLAKKREDWWDECRITAKQFDRAIEVLEEKKLVVTKLFRFAGSPTKHIRLNWDALFEALKVLADTVFTKRSKSNFPKGQNPISPKSEMDIDETGRTYTERTTQITSEITHTYLERAQEKIEPEPIEASAEVEKSVPEDPSTTFTEPTQISRQPDDLSLGKDSGAATVAVITEPLVITEPSRTPSIDKLPSASSEHRRATPTTPAQPTPDELKEVSRQLRELQVNPDSCRGVIIKYWANVQGAIALLKNFKGARNPIAVFINACKEGTAPESNLRPRSAIPDECRPPSVEQAAALDAAKNRALIRDYFFSTVDGVTKVVLTGGRQLPWWEFLEVSQC